MDLWLEADSPLAPLGLWLEAEICKDLWLEADSAISVYNTFVHIATPPIGLRRIQSAPGDLSLLRPTEAEDDQSVLEPETAVAAEDPQDYTAVTERKVANLSGNKGRRGKQPSHAVSQGASLLPPDDAEGYEWESHQDDISDASPIGNNDSDEEESSTKRNQSSDEEEIYHARIDISFSYLSGREFADQ